MYVVKKRRTPRSIKFSAVSNYQVKFTEKIKGKTVKKLFEGCVCMCARIKEFMQNFPFFKFHLFKQIIKLIKMMEKVSTWSMNKDGFHLKVSTGNLIPCFLFPLFLL